MSDREQVIEAAARAAFETDYEQRLWPSTAVSERFKNLFRAYASAALDAALPVLLNDLADRIEAQAASGPYAAGDATFNLGTDRAAAIVRATAERWAK